MMYSLQRPERSRPRTRHRRRGSVALSAIVALVVILIVVVGLMTLATEVLMNGYNTAHSRALRNLAESGIQYGYWQFSWGTATLPYSGSMNLADGKFSVSVTDNSANLVNTFKVVSTATRRNQTYVVTRIFANPGIRGLYNTGVDDSSAVLADGSTDSHYNITQTPLGLPGTPFVTSSFLFPSG